MDSSLITDVIGASEDKKVFGKIRLQKIFYLLDQLGLDSGFTYSYHHYGPYSEDLSNTLFFAEFFDKVIVESQGKTKLGNIYSVFSLSENANEMSPEVGKLSSDDIKTLVNTLEAPTSVVIELAATIHWLREKEGVAEWEAELKARKTGKATDENIKKSVDLLGSIGL
ncbi:hypothetical protein [Hoeflea poritis]|uniref:Antitoxin SocA-like Panacea domain-containing protein n=1 Tax=Hoeflea poritis TaxID=2993659 RepID=A0ABT4VPU6_9HYPH|nr:hypothetical protein [Hoeflea poritis]MDA4846730.1 hypothetical protein [Hoeflea poritis]